MLGEESFGERKAVILRNLRSFGVGARLRMTNLVAAVPAELSLSAGRSESRPHTSFFLLVKRSEESAFLVLPRKQIPHRAEADLIGMTSIRWLARKCGDPSLRSG